MLNKTIRAIGVVLVIAGIANFDPSGWRNISSSYKNEPLIPIAIIVVGVVLIFHEEIFAMFSRGKR